ncbi:hypothetical protein ACE939_15260 [Aquimarina sp. W85]|uniref:hypothetical protein n=1 Tax=Aquimarina rhodophyticola TaxID=3342246 RepID=UPI00366EA487
MSLQIINNKGVYEICGNLTRQNLSLVHEKFSHLLNHYEEVVMSLDFIEKIDNYGLELLKSIRLKALQRSKVLFVLIKSNNHLLATLKRRKSTYILREDY